MSEPTTAAMMAELREAVQRIQDRQFEDWLNENLPHWRDVAEVLAQASANWNYSAENMAETLRKMNEFAPKMSDFKGTHPDTPSANP